MKKNPHILLVEDDIDLLNLYRMSLEKAGFQVVCAENGLDGISKSFDHEIDLILLDLMMPMADGRDVLSLAQMNEKLKDTPIIIISNLNPGTIDLSGFDDHIIDYWVKSELSPKSLRQKLVEYFS